MKLKNKIVDMFYDAKDSAGFFLEDRVDDVKAVANSPFTWLAMGAFSLISSCDCNKIQDMKRDLVINKSVPAERVENYKPSLFNFVRNQETLLDLSRMDDSVKITKSHPDWSATRVSREVGRLWR